MQATYLMLYECQNPSEIDLTNFLSDELSIANSVFNKIFYLQEQK